MSYIMNALDALRRSDLNTERCTAALIKSLQHGGYDMSRFQYLNVLSELANHISMRSDLSHEEAFRRLASLPRETLMSEAKQLIEALTAVR
jgi:hypothetical protein